MNNGWLEPPHLRRLLASTPLPRTAIMPAAAFPWPEGIAERIIVALAHLDEPYA
ncbi:hypothetical protein AB0C61_25495 [Streptomyces sp. NPDC048680]|uniref:hypothetical protein n=1 Tax=Streptomyces sp. NPDC048680 TaxID=3155492 RepID=UPI003428FF1E